MKLKIRYENEFQTLELNEDETRQLCVSLSIETENPSEKEIQKAFDIQFNRPDYNNWHRLNRHTDPDPHIKCLNGHKGFILDEGESLGGEFFEQYPDKKAVMPDFEYEDLCKYIKSILKPNQAELLIAICLDGITITEYAEKEGVVKQVIFDRLKTAKKNFKKKYKKSLL